MRRLYQQPLRDDDFFCERRGVYCYHHLSREVHCKTNYRSITAIALLINHAFGPAFKPGPVPLLLSPIDVLFDFLVRFRLDVLLALFLLRVLLVLNRFRPLVPFLFVLLFLLFFSFDGFAQKFRVVQDFLSSRAFQRSLPGVLLGDAFAFFGLVAASVG